MAVQTTPNLGLTLPYQSDPVAVSTQNSNMALIDTAVGALPSGSTIQGQIDNLGQSERTAYQGQTAIQDYLLTVANGMKDGEVKLLRIRNADAGFQSLMPIDQTFEGYIKCTYKDSNSLYFVWTAYSAAGNDIVFGYAGGTWSVYSLNSNFIREDIPTNSDFNSYTLTSGSRDKHYVGNNLGSISNKPGAVGSSENVPYTLDVISLNGYTTQILNVYGSVVRSFQRNQYYYGGAVQWGPWTLLTIDESLDTAYSDLNNLKRTGFYQYNGNSSNAPSTNGGCLMCCFGSGGTQGMQIAHANNQTYLSFRAYNNGTWTAWKSFSLT